MDNQKFLKLRVTLGALRIIAVVTVALLILSGCGAAQQPVTNEHGEDAEPISVEATTMRDKIEDATTPLDTEGEQSRENIQITFEQFTQNMKSGLSEETLAEVKALYEEFMQADMEGKNAVIQKLHEMDVFMDACSAEGTSSRGN